MHVLLYSNNTSSQHCSCTPRLADCKPAKTIPESYNRRLRRESSKLFAAACLTAQANSSIEKAGAAVLHPVSFVCSGVLVGRCEECLLTTILQFERVISSAVISHHGDRRSEHNGPPGASSVLASNATSTTPSNAQGHSEPQYKSTTCWRIPRGFVLGARSMARQGVQCCQKSERNTNPPGGEGVATRNPRAEYLCIPPYPNEPGGV